MKMAWVTDSTCYIDKQVQDKMKDLYVVPLSIIIGEEQFQEGVDLSIEELFEKLKKTTNVSTSQPSIGKFEQLYRKLSIEYDHIISVHLSSKLSGTYATAVQASKLVPGIPISVIDSNILTFPLTELLLLGKEHEENGLSPFEIEERLLKTIETLEAYVMVGSLEQLHRSGRMNGVSFFLGSVLNIKPILSVEKGALVVKEKVRSTKKGFSKMIDYLEESIAKHSIRDVCLLHGLDKEEVEKKMKRLVERFPQINFHLRPLGAVIGVHGGENTMGITWFNKKY